MEARERKPIYTELAAAFVRGRLGRHDLSDRELIALGRERGLRLHRFKRGELPRVRRVIGILKGLRPAGLLDARSGCGTFLWPLLDALPELPVTAIDLAFFRVRDLAAARAGGVTRLRPSCQSTLAPGAGKDHWIRRHLAGRPAISLDNLRRQLGVDAAGNQGRVIQEARR